MRPAKIITATFSAIILATYVHAQGSLTPPGAPAATMKTLQQVEPRTPISSAPATIFQPGSYYLTTNLSGKVTFASDNVTLDLMGFSIVAASGSAIGQSGARANLLVRNGVVSAPAGNGIEFSISTSDANGTIEDLRIAGCKNHGIAVGGGYRIRNCQINGAVLAGIRVYGNSDIRHCTLTGNGTGLQLSGTGAYVADNIVRGNTDNFNFSTGNQLNLLLCEVPESIDWTASVKFAGTLTCPLTNTNGITVNADDVTLHMAGHALIGTGATSGHGIYQASTFRNLSVLNGKVVNWSGPLKGGVYAASWGCRISGIQAATNYYGIYAGSGSTLSDCVARDNTGTGIRADYGSTVSGCAARRNTGTGIHVYSGCTLIGCAASYNNGNGILALEGCTISDCATSFNYGDGIQIGYDNRVVNCLCDSNGFNDDSAGIHAYNTDNCIEGNTVTDNDRGIDVDVSGNFIVRNSASGNTLNWDVAAGNVCLVVQAATAGAISGNSGGTAPGSTDPNANFTY